MNAPFVCWVLASTWLPLALLSWWGPTPLPTMLEAVNANQLLIFLVANVLTGLVNLTMATRIQPLWVSLCILHAYGLLYLGMAWLLYRKQLIIRFK